MLIKPYSAYTAADTTAANFPFLKGGFHHSLNVNASAGTWGDIIDPTNQLINTSNFTVNADGSIIIGAGTSQVPTVNEAPGTNDVLLFSILYRPTASAYAVEVGNSTVDDGVGVTANGTNYVSLGATYITLVNPALGDIGSAGSPGAVGVKCDWSADEAPTIEGTNAGVITTNGVGTPTGSVAAGISAFTTDQYTFTAAGCHIYGSYYCVFDNGVPADVETAISWMISNPDKGMYPGWIGIA